ncbi:transcription antitermination factor NusB [Clostridium perfringens]|jgi:transcription antitermination protein NusB|uniref:Transcription antitermination protein NusB n=2 Tax=Clostridium perfringens TaxID=1502 RepID=NUSB_CLOPS|nr:transcription antitermination factor NusB [Clostridium perfringens]Q0SS00.1 RecName: Full=Transcription antitermination protein NusB; AltName: Full=Antitermination factor NusB [Clostridium perfringens SM101]ABG86942.1 N utilization substance protein B [Clostridium perfringens SM101]AOY54593.1 Transcription termination protein NusB [Clostridium perfringens]EIF6166826.1 transcription antitermination factor NusB [Clostridium perfringens]EJT5916275.1 transcription antitermination factor NusB [C
MNRVKSREYLLQLAYQMEITSETALETFNSFMENEDISKDDLDLAYIKSGLLGIEENKEKLDSLIESQLVKWKLNRISKVNLSILRISTYEILFAEDVPGKVSINEAIELCKKYSDNKSVSFINGVLDKVYKNIK